MAPAETRSAADYLPDDLTLPSLTTAAAGCRGCDLYRNATQTVFGDGSARARVMLVGEQPGDKEDVAGEPFVGPAGRLLDQALDAAGIDRRAAYITNVVKHFAWVPRGKRRIHRKPNMAEITACRPWLEAEIAAVKPAALVCLGATAAQAVIGKDFRVTKQRGTFVASELAALVSATVHPSSILRTPDDGTRRREMELFVADLAKVAQALAKLTQ